MGYSDDPITSSGLIPYYEKQVATLEKDYDDLLSENTKLKKLLGGFCIDALQENYEPLRNYAATTHIVFLGGVPAVHLKKEAQ